MGVGASAAYIAFAQAEADKQRAVVQSNFFRLNANDPMPEPFDPADYDDEIAAKAILELIMEDDRGEEESGSGSDEIQLRAQENEIFGIEDSAAL